MESYFDLIWGYFRAMFLLKPWLEWLFLIVLVSFFVYLVFLVLSRTAVSKFWKVFLIIVMIPVSSILFYVPHFYKYKNAGVPDVNCPQLTFNTYTNELEPIRYEYLSQHLVAGTKETGFVDFFVKNYDIFGENKIRSNTHICRVSYDEAAKKLLKNLQKAKDAQVNAAKALNVPPEQAVQLGGITFTLPGSVESRARLGSFRKKHGDQVNKNRDDSFGHAEFSAPQQNNDNK
jgi:hypothetical protein